MSARWHILRDQGAVTLARHLPPRFDILARTVLPGASPLRLAHQIRQDVWRALRGVRGFSPVVRLTPAEGGWLVEAGGRVLSRASGLSDRVRDVLETPEHRARWTRHANRGRAA